MVVIWIRCVFGRVGYRYDSRSTPALTPHIKLHTFDSTTPCETFWAHFKNCCSYNQWKEADKLAHLKASLTGNAGQILWDSDPSATDSLAKLTALLHSRYSGSHQSDKYQMELRLLPRRAGKSFRASPSNP